MSTYQVKAHLAYAGYEENGVTSLHNPIRSLFVKFYSWLKNRNDYHNAVAELHAMSDRDLADIGIVRCDIEATLRQATKEKSARR